MSACEHCGETHQTASLFCPNTGKLIPSQLLPEGALLEGKYRIGQTIGVGGMGAVFEARHTLLDKRVAIKVMLPEGGAEMAQQFSARMVREARAASATGHRNIAQVTDMGWVREGSMFVVMEFLEGHTLRHLLENNKQLPLPRAVGLMRQVLSGLEVVHRKGIVHRDLKPENLMVVRDDEGEEVVKILDFGVSKVLRSNGERDLNLTSTGLVIGTPQYMSPEQAKSSAQIDHRTDIYSAGAILYRMVTGTLPHQQETLNALIAAVLAAPVDPPSSRCPGLPAALDQVLLSALAREPERRYDSARAFRDALDPFAEESAAVISSSRPPPPPSYNAAAFGNVDESLLVALDETAAPPAAPAPPTPAPVAAAAAVAPLDQASSPAAPPELDPFAPPEEEEELALELDAGGPAHARPSAPAPERGGEDLSSPDAPAPHPRASGPYGQALRRPSRTGLWVGLGAAVVAALLIWRLVLQDDGTDVAAATPDGGSYVEISIDVSPRFAEVTVDGVTLTSNPLVLQRSNREYVVSVKAKGYVGQTISFTPDQNRSLLVELKPRAQPD